MLKGKGKDPGYSRRSFLKAGALGTVALGAVATGMFSFSGWLKKADAADTAVEERVAYTYHKQHCLGHCSLKCTTREGRLCLVEPNDTWGEDRMRAVCSRGISEVQHIYSAERIQTPLKRVGERGAGDFVSITWDEALGIIKKEIEKSWDKYGRDSVIFKTSLEPFFPFLASLLGAQTGGKAGLDNGIDNGTVPAFGVSGHLAPNDLRDFVNAKNVLLFGTNPFESCIADSVYFHEAIEAGAKFITMDPHFSTTASKSETWVPITAGTDAALVLGMITEILDNAWQDEDFMRQYTGFPFLVDVKDGSYLRGPAPAFEPDPAKSDAKAPEAAFMVWDGKTQTAVQHTDTEANAELEGTFTVDGKQYKTVFTLLKENQKQYSVSWASQVTSVPEKTIREIAKRYATEKPSTISYGWGGTDKFSNADIFGHALTVMVALTGNTGVPGASVGSAVGWVAFSAPKLPQWPIPKEYKPAAAPVSIYDFPYKKNNAHVFISVGDKFIQRQANSNVFLKWAKTLDFVVHIDIYNTPAVAWADIVLPASTKFESNSELNGILTVNGHVQLGEKVLDPLFDSKPDFDIQNEFAKLFGLDSLMPKTEVEYVKYRIENAVDPTIKGLTFEKLQKNQGLYCQDGFETPRIMFPDRVYKTRSTRLEPYYDDLVTFNQQLPSYETPCEAYAENPLTEKYPLMLSSMRTRFQIHNQFVDATWLRQFNQPCIEINPVDAEARGLKQADIAEVFNDRGSFSSKVNINSIVRPGTVRINEGIWPKYLVSGGVQNVTNDTMIERGYKLVTGPVIPFNDTLIEVRKAGGAS